MACNFTKQDIGGCACVAPPGCGLTISGKVKGCGGLGLSGATVEARDSTSTGTLLDSTTTDGSGDYTLDITDAVIGNDIIVVAKRTRFDDGSLTYQYNGIGDLEFWQWACDAAIEGADITLEAADGYICCGFCPLPLKEDLDLTISGNPVSMSYVSTGGGPTWVGYTTKPGVTILSSVTWDDVNFECVCNTTTADITVGFVFDCDGKLTEYYGGVITDPCSPNYVNIEPSGVSFAPIEITVDTECFGVVVIGNMTTESTGTVTCSAFSVTGTMGAGANDPTAPITGGWTLTESA